MKISENNRLIAEFMGVTPNEGGEYEMYGVIECIEDSPRSKHFFFASEMKFSDSYDWLMPVIFKLQQVTEEPEELDSLKYNLWFNTLDSVYASVVNDIKWYNQQKA